MGLSDKWDLVLLGAGVSALSLAVVLGSLPLAGLAVVLLAWDATRN